jgi:hypothetical protein
LKKTGFFPFDPQNVLSRMPGKQKRTYKEYVSQFQSEEKEALEIASMAKRVSDNRDGDSDTDEAPVVLSPVPEREDLWGQTASEPTANRSRRGRKTSNARLKQHPFGVAFDPRLDVFDFNKTENQKQIGALMMQDSK